MLALRKGVGMREWIVEAGVVIVAVTLCTAHWLIA